MPTTWRTAKQRLMLLGGFAASFEAEQYDSSWILGGVQISPGLFTSPRTELNEIARKFLAYCDSGVWLSKRVNWPATIRTPEAVSLLGDPIRPTGDHACASDRNTAGERIDRIHSQRTWRQRIYEKRD